MTTPADGTDRISWLAARRRNEADRFDRRFAASYDEHWGAISPTHAMMVDRFLRLCAPGGEILDAACGTGKYWPAILASGRRARGIDQSGGMLAQAALKFPGVATELRALTDLDAIDAYDGVMCVDAMEYVPPEEWPAVLEAFRRALHPGGHMYLTVEQIDPAELEEEHQRSVEAGHPVVPGESVRGAQEDEDVGYHYFPGREQVMEWLRGAALVPLEERVGDHYLHVIARRVPNG
jgi:SAM-dependent methyltransferase